VLHGAFTKRDVVNKEGTPISVLLVLSQVTTGLLDRAASLVQKAARHDRVSVMVLSRQDLQRSTDVFPVKFLDMRESHIVLHGESVLDDLLIDDGNLRLRCEQESRNILLRLRSFYLHQARDPKQVQAALTSAVSSLLTTLNAFLFLTDGSFRRSETEIAKAATDALRLESDALETLLAARAKQSQLDEQDLKKVFDGLMNAAQRAADVIDRFRTADK
jgi:hypothetical protein